MNPSRCISRVSALNSSRPLTFLSHARQPFTTSTCLLAGHSKWANIKHRKGAVDKKRQALNQELSRQITIATREGGADKGSNPALVSAITAAKAANATNTLIDRAIARGLGRSLSGAALEKVTLEVIMPGGVAMVIEMETDSKLRSLQDVSTHVRRNGGKLGSTLFYFDQLGRVSLDPKLARERWDDLFDFVVAGNGVDLDVPENERLHKTLGDACVWTEPEKATEVAKALKEKFGLHPRSVDRVWRPKVDMKTALDSDKSATSLVELLGALHEFPEVNATFISVSKGEASGDEWQKIQDSIIFR